MASQPPPSPAPPPPEDATRADPFHRRETRGLPARERPEAPGNPSPAGSPPGPDLVGQWLGTYEVLERLGQGGMGVVYRARDLTLQRDVALKVISPEHARSADAVARFLREARAAAALAHPGIVPIFSADVVGGLPYIAMELVHGRSLSELLRDRGRPLGPRRAVGIARSVAAALAHAHSRGVIHRDIKPGNIMVEEEPEERVRLMDLGLARPMPGTRVDLEEEGITRLGTFVGTPGYASPEQMLGESVDGRSDLYSLGVVLYELLTGQRPFRAASLVELIGMVLREDPPRLSGLVPSVPPALERVVARLLAREPGGRYASAQELLDALDAVAATLTGSSSQQMTGALDHAVLANLPPEMTDLVGRQASLTRLRDRLLGTPGAEPASGQLVTLTGVAGVGKTRLALRLGHQLREEFPGGVWFADLRGAEGPESIAHAVLLALEVPGSHRQAPLESAANVLEFRPPLLLILDGFEAMVQHAATTVERWRELAPQVVFLVTSRTVLGLPGEVEHPLEPLSAPSRRAPALDREAAATYEGVQLFVSRARQASPGFELTPDNAAQVAAIVAELDGLPLAIELAAARIRVLQPQQIVARLGRKFELLRSARGEQDTRQRSLLGALEWSFELLAPEERETFLQVAIFRGGFFLEAAEAVVDLEGAVADPPLVIDLIQALREKSFLHTRSTPYGVRLDLYGVVRDFAWRRWEDRPPERREALTRRHASHMVEYAEEWNRTIFSPRQQEALDRVELELENLQALRELRSGEAELVARGALAAAQTIALRGPMELQVPWLEEALAALPDRAEQSELRAQLLRALSSACQASGEWERARELAAQALRASEGLGRSRIRAAALSHAAAVHGSHFEMDEALECLDGAELLALELGDQVRLAGVLNNRGNIFNRMGRREEALECYRQAESLNRKLGNLAWAAAAVGNQGDIHRQRGEYELALACHEEATALDARLDNKASVAGHLSARANVLLPLGRLEEALLCNQQAEAIARGLGSKLDLAAIACTRGLIHLEQEQVEEAHAAFQESETLFRGLGHKLGTATVLANLGTTHQRRGKDAEALRALEEATSLLEPMRRLDELSQVLHLRGDLRRRGGEPELALELYQGAGEMAQQLGEHQRELRLCAARCLTLLQLDRKPEALELARQGLEHGGAHGLQASPEAFVLHVCAARSGAAAPAEPGGTHLEAARALAREREYSGEEAGGQVAEAHRLLEELGDL